MIKLVELIMKLTSFQIKRRHHGSRIDTQNYGRRSSGRSLSVSRKASSRSRKNVAVVRFGQKEVAEKMREQSKSALFLLKFLECVFNCRLISC